MKLQIFFFSILCMVNTALSIKCFINGTTSGAGATSTECPTTPADSKICQRLSVYSGTTVARNYLCVPQSVVTAAGYTDAVTDDLICKNITVGTASSEQCFCKKEDCNNINILTSPTTSPLKCYKGTDKPGTANTTCATGEDRCFNQTKEGKVESKCFKLMDLDNKTMTDDACKTESDVKTCLCKTDNCNNPSGTAGPISQSLFQIFVVIVFSSFLRLGMS